MIMSDVTATRGNYDRKSALSGEDFYNSFSNSWLGWKKGFPRQASNGAATQMQADAQ
jgi:hypothetical protein